MRASQEAVGDGGATLRSSEAGSQALGEGGHLFISTLPAMPLLHLRRPGVLLDAHVGTPYYIA